jgi:hypothetical protein
MKKQTQSRKEAPGNRDKMVRKFGTGSGNYNNHFAPLRLAAEIAQEIDRPRRSKMKR